MKPADLLDASRILLSIDGALSKREVIRMLISAAVGGSDGAADVIAAELIAREEKMTTGIGRGVAIPHARSARVDEPVAALGVSPEGVDFGSLDEEPVKIVFTFTTPEIAPAVHIRMLACAVALFGSDQVRSAIIAASDPATVLDIIKSAPLQFID